MNAPSRADLDVLEALEKGTDPASLPRDAIERLSQFKLVALRPPGRVILTGNAKEVLLRREYGLALPITEPQPDEEDSGEAPDEDRADGEDGEDRQEP